MSAAAPLISVRNLVKSFNGFKAVQDVSFDLMPGQVVGFIGANGAGKTTTMRMMVTLEIPDSGEITVCGRDALEDPLAVRRMVGWMPDSYGVYPNMSVFDYLDFYARSCGLKGQERVDRVREVMAFADLLPLADRPMNGLSKGMGQRLCFGRTLIPNPQILVLDEPAAGLDPKARIEFKNLVQILSRQGATIFISSHILSELAEMCDALLFIDGGRIVHQGTAEALRQHATGAVCPVEIHVDGSEAPLLEWIATHPGWVLLSHRAGVVRAEFETASPADLSTQLRRMIHDGLAVVDFHRQERRLEEVFVDVLKSNPAPLAPPPLPPISAK